MADWDPEAADLFLRAGEITAPEDRLQFLDQSCAGRPALRERVDGLIRADEQAGSVLEHPAPDPGSASAHTPHAAGVTAPVPSGSTTVVGPYKLVQEIGEGGMGTVYLAQQAEPVRRLVAVKLIKPGMDSRQVLARFEAERQALALMDHPNIARVLDAGAMPDGRPYFVMELVKGVPITRYCDDHRLGVRERLVLFADVCRAVQHAHQKGVIHRDLKPSNVLVASYDARPVVKVIDFGVAKATGQPLTDRTLVTMLGAVVGTPEYMSPEQAELNNLDIDTRSDIYALGVLLYELLTGTTPLTNRRVKELALLELLRAIREEEPPRPSSRLSTTDELPRIASVRGVEPTGLSRLLQGELDWIAMKALEKDRNRRYETANALAMDVERYLADEAVQACPPSRTYRLRKFARKNRMALGTAAAFALLLIAATGVSTWQAVRATRAEGLAEERLSGTKKAQAATQVALEQSEAVSKFLTEAFRSPDPSQDGRQIKVADVLDRAVARLDRDFTGSPMIRGALLQALGETYQGLGLYSQAASVLEKTRAVWETALGPDHPDTLMCCLYIGAANQKAGRSVETIPLLEEALKRCEAKLGPDHLVTLSARNNLGDTYRAAGRPVEAIPLLEQTLKQLEATQGPDHLETFETRNNLALAYSDSGRRTEAISLFEGTLKQMETKLGPHHPETLNTRNNLGYTYNAAGRAADAIRLLVENLKQCEAKLGSDHLVTLLARQILGDAYREAGRTTDLIPLLAETLRQKEARLGPDHAETLTCRNNLGDAYGAAGRSADAIRLFEANLKQCEAKLGPDHGETLRTRNSLAVAYGDDGRWAEAIRLHEDTRKQCEAKLGPDHPLTLTCRNNLAVAYSAAGRSAEAIPLLEQALHANGKSPKLRSVGVLLLNNYGRAGRHAEAARLVPEILADARKTFPKDSPQLAGTLAMSGSTLVQVKAYAEAEPLLRECLLFREKTEPDAWSTFNAKSLLGGALLGQKKYADAEPLIVAAYEGMRAREAKIPPLAKSRLPEAAERAVKLYDAWGKKEQAAEWRAKLARPSEEPKHRP
jgi:serine/threonine protein kinase